MNNLFSFSTAYLILALIFLVMPIATWLTLATLRSSSVRIWCLGNLLFGLGIFSIGLRSELSDWISYPLANFSIWFSAFMMMQAIRIELRHPFKWRWAFFFCLISLLIFESLRAVPSLQTYRFAWGLGMPMVAFTFIALWSYRLYFEEKIKSAIWIASVFAIAVVGLVFRIGRLFFTHVDLADAMSPNIDGTITVITGILAAIFGNMGYIGMYFERSYRRDKLLAIEQERNAGSDRLRTAIANMDRHRSMSVMSAALAHELSQPLTAAKVDSLVLEGELKRDQVIGDKKWEILGDLQLNLERAVQIVTRIHDFIKSREPKMERVCWHDIYTDVIHLLPKSERPDGTKINFYMRGHAVSYWVRGDHIQLSQVLLNLLRNSLQAQSKERFLEIQVEENMINDQICLSIIDNGKGMDEATIEGAMTAFFSTKNDGLGVGLAISKSILEQHGGSLVIHSVLGQGTQVKLTLPIY